MKTSFLKNKRTLFGILGALFIVFLFGALSLARPQLTSLPYLSMTRDTLGSSLPKVDIKVNKKYDDKGNLLEYDSVWTYESHSGDSIFRSSKFRFGKRSGRFDSFFDFNEPFADTSEWFPGFGPFSGHKDIEELEREMYRHMQWIDSIMNRMWPGRFDPKDEFFRRPFDDFFRHRPAPFSHSVPDSFFYHFNIPVPRPEIKRDTIWY